MTVFVSHSEEHFLGHGGTGTDRVGLTGLVHRFRQGCGAKGSRGACRLSPQAAHSAASRGGARGGMGQGGGGQGQGQRRGQRGAPVDSARARRPRGQGPSAGPARQGQSRVAARRPARHSPAGGRVRSCWREAGRCQGQESRRPSRRCHTGTEDPRSATRPGVCLRLLPGGQGAPAVREPLGLTGNGRRGRGSLVP